MQLVRTMSFHSEKFGLHWKMVTNITTIAWTVMTNPIPQLTQRVHSNRKILRYSWSMTPFESATASEHTTGNTKNAFILMKSISFLSSRKTARVRRPALERGTVTTNGTCWYTSKAHTYRSRGHSLEYLELVLQRPEHRPIQKRPAEFGEISAGGQR